MRFWDSSALIPLYVRETHSSAMCALVEADAGMVA
jgi:predicted nucleic acid-binding protein